MSQRYQHPVSAKALWVCLAATLVLQPIWASPVTKRSTALLTHHLTKRSFFEIQCKGVYDKAIFARLDRICEDCYNLFREPQLHTLCSKNCFTTTYFEGCVDTLQLDEEKEDIKTWLKHIHGAEPGF